MATNSFRRQTVCVTDPQKLPRFAREGAHPPPAPSPLLVIHVGPPPFRIPVSAPEKGLHVAMCYKKGLHVTMCHKKGLHVTMCYKKGLHVTMCYKKGLHVTMCYKKGLHVTMCYKKGLHVTMCYKKGLHVTMCYKGVCVTIWV